MIGRFDHGPVVVLRGETSGTDRPCPKYVSRPKYVGEKVPRLSPDTGRVPGCSRRLRCSWWLTGASRSRVWSQEGLVRRVRVVDVFGEHFVCKEDTGSSWKLSSFSTPVETVHSFLWFRREGTDCPLSPPTPGLLPCHENYSWTSLQFETGFTTPIHQVPPLVLGVSVRPPVFHVPPHPTLPPKWVTRVTSDRNQCGPHVTFLPSDQVLPRRSKSVRGSIDLTHLLLSDHTFRGETTKKSPQSHVPFPFIPSLPLSRKGTFLSYTPREVR